MLQSHIAGLQQQQPTAEKIKVMLAGIDTSSLSSITCQVGALCDQASSINSSKQCSVKQGQTCVLIPQLSLASGINSFMICIVKPSKCEPRTTNVRRRIACDSTSGVAGRHIEMTQPVSTSLSVQHFMSQYCGHA